mmetsp:Transcript_36163/g.84772  ORF Transcript_36163/g.84772 Transcript_36163/m.84772 type:complete len:251 (+) Transcript_36163:83-835(+)
MSARLWLWQVLVAIVSGRGLAVQLHGISHIGGTPRLGVCQECHKSCPISCFVGVCPLEQRIGVRRYYASNLCFSCDRSSLLELCSVEETGAALSPIVIGESGNVDGKTFSDVMDEAVKMANMTADELQAHEQAMIVRADEALRASEAANMEAKQANAQYQTKLQALDALKKEVDLAKANAVRAQKAADLLKQRYETMVAVAEHVSNVAADAATRASPGPSPQLHFVPGNSSATNSSSPMGSSTAVNPCDT